MREKLSRLHLAALAGALACAFVAGGLALDRQDAQAHGVQVASEPAPNARLFEPPEMITITFSEPIEPSVSTIELWDQSAQRVPLGEYESLGDPTQLAIHVPDDLAPGLYTVIWRNLSTVDGHTWSGSFPFTVLGAGGALPTAEVPAVLRDLGKAPSANPSTLESAARWVVLLGSAVLLGGSAYVLFVVSPAARVLAPERRDALRGVWRTVLLVTAAIAVFLALEGSLLQLVVQADRLGGLGRADDLLVDTRFGRYLIARQVLLGVALLATGLLWRLRSERWDALGLGLLLFTALGVLLTQSLVSHGAASDGPVWATTIDALHLIAASVWVGALIHIGLAMPRWLDELSSPSRTLFAAESFRRFSLLAAGSVVVLLTSGVLSALVQFTSWPELWETSYGRSLLGKLGAMLPLLAVGGLNAFVLRPRVVEAAHAVSGGASDADSRQPVERLQRLLATTVRAEAVLGIAVLVAVAVLIQLQSPRTTAEAAEQAAEQSVSTQPVARDRGFFQEQAEVEGVIMQLRIEPAQVGENSFELGMGAEFGSIGEVLQARLDFDHEREEVGRSQVDLQLSGSARYTASGSFLSLPGEWTVTATVRRRGADDLRATFQVPVGEPGAQDGAPSAQEDGSESLWAWPFQGRRSLAAIALLSAVGAGVAGRGALGFARRRG